MVVVAVGVLYEQRSLIIPWERYASATHKSLCVPKARALFVLIQYGFL